MLPAPFLEEGGASKANAPAGTPATHNNLTHWNCKKLSSDRHLYASYAFFNYRIPIYDRSGSTWRHHQWKQAETMVALATLPLQSAKKLFQKGNLKTKYEALTLSGSDVCTQSVCIDPSFRIILYENPALKWPSFVRQSGVKWHDFIDFFQYISIKN